MSQPSCVAVYQIWCFVALLSLIQSRYQVALGTAVGVYDSVGSRFGTVINLVGAGGIQAMARVPIGSRVFTFLVFFDHVRSLTGQLGQLHYQAKGCTGTPMMWWRPDALVPPAEIMQPGSVLWVPADGAQGELVVRQSFLQEGTCIDSTHSNYYIPAVSLGPFPYTAPFSVR